MYKKRVKYKPDTASKHQEINSCSIHTVITDIRLYLFFSAKDSNAQILVKIFLNVFVKLQKQTNIVFLSK